MSWSSVIDCKTDSPKIAEIRDSDLRLVVGVLDFKVSWCFMVSRIFLKGFSKKCFNC